MNPDKNMKSMEALYKKLYDKYCKLKNKNLSELDDVNREQELKFSTYVKAAEELIDYLRNENEKLYEQVNHWRSEVDLIRSKNNEKCIELQQLLMEENRKSKALSEEVKRLEKLIQEESSSRSRDENNGDMQLVTPEGAQTTSDIQSSGRSTERKRKHRREFGSGSGREYTIKRSRSDHDDAIAGQSAKDISNVNLSCGDLVSDQLPECCKRTVDTSGGGKDDSRPANCLYDALAEYLLGMKFSTSHQSEGVCISALHQSSGFSFSLTWVKMENGEGFDLLYRVLSLGTFERVAPEWMKDVIMFSTNMCPMFFERISRVIKMHH